MAETIDDIASNSFYYDDSLIYNFDQSDVSDDLIESREIRNHMQVLIDNLNDKCLDKKLHLSKMHELETQFLNVLKKRSFMRMRDKINSLRTEGSNYELGRGMKTKVDDLVKDIEQFYDNFIPWFERNLVCLDTSNLLNPYYSSEHAMKFFLDETKHATDLLYDLDERIADILHLFEPTSTNIQMKRICPQKRASLIARIAERIVNKCQMNLGRRKDIFEMARLYRRMAWLQIDVKFLEFSPRDAKRYEMFERIAKYQDVLHREGRGFYDYADIVRKLERLKWDIKEQCRQYLDMFTRHDQFFNKTVEEPKVKVVIKIVKIGHLFTNISNTFETYVKRFEMIRKLMDEAWNTQLQLNSS